MAGEWPFSYLSALDNDVDLAPSVLHRTCVPFSDQMIGGGAGVESAPCGGTRVYWRDHEPHAGRKVVERV